MRGAEAEGWRGEAGRRGGARLLGGCPQYFMVHDANRTWNFCWSLSKAWFAQNMGSLPLAGTFLRYEAQDHRYSTKTT